MDRCSRQKINKTIEVLNDLKDPLNLKDILRIFHPKAAEYSFFSRTHGIFSGMDHTLDHKANLSKFTEIEIISIF